MKPDKPGFWWYKIKSNSRYTDEKIIDLNGFSVKGFNAEIAEVENDPVFVRWLGQAHPPKLVPVLRACNFKPETKVVSYESVKEYLK